MTTLRAHWSSPDQARSSFLGYVAPWVKAQLDAGESVDVYLSVHEDEGPTEKQRKYYHGVVLKEIALFGVVGGLRYDIKTWKEHFRREHLKDRRVRRKNPITGKWIYEKKRASTEDLSVKKYNELIEKVTAFAVTELGITFSASRWETWDGMEVDPETGEIK